MSTIKRTILSVAATLVLVLGVGAPAVADCGANPGVIATTGGGGTSQIFTQRFAETPYVNASYPGFYYGGYGATAYCGAGGGCTPVSPDVQVSFWSQGLGDPAATGPTGGIDNGVFDLVAAGQLVFPTYTSVGFYAGAEFYNAGWAPGTDGCIGSGNCLCVLLTDTDGVDTFFAVVSGLSDSGFTTALNRGGADGSGNYNAPIVMTRMQAPTITGSSRNGTDLLFDAIVNAPAGGVYQSEGGGCNCGPTGYKVLQKIVPRGGVSIFERDYTGWTDISGVIPIGTPALDLPTICGTADLDVYLATQLFFDGDFSTPFVSGNSSRIECGTTLADPDDRPRVRPTDVRPSERPRSRGGRGR